MLFLSLVCLGLVASSFAVQLSPTYSVTWTVNGDRITFDIVAETTGWVGLGLNNDGSMTGADIVIAGVNNGQKYIHVSPSSQPQLYRPCRTRFQDMHSDGYEQPSLDSKQDYELLKASENATHTSLTIRRPLETKDKSDFAIAVSQCCIFFSVGLKCMVFRASQSICSGLTIVRSMSPIQHSSRNTPRKGPSR